MFQPVVTSSGIGGWNFLQATYDRQLTSFSESPQIRNDQEYMLEKLSQPLEKKDFLDDQRLLRITMTAFDLGGEEWKRGFVDKVLTEVVDPESSFLTRLNNQPYTRYAEAFAPSSDGKIRLSESALADIATKFETASFEAALGEVDNNMRLALNFQSDIATLVGDGSNEQAGLFRILGDVPVRSVLESALSLPSETRQLPIERQAEIVKDKLSSSFGINDLSDLTKPEMVERVVQRFLALSSIDQAASSTTPGAVALALLSPSTGLGGTASQNLFLSLIR